MNNREITDEIAIDKLKDLIADREKQKSLLPLFMTEEIDNLQMEINMYRKQLQKIENGVQV